MDKVVLRPINKRYNVKQCDICSEKLNPGNRKTLFLKGYDLDLTAGVICADCWYYILKHSIDRKADFIHNSIIKEQTGRKGAIDL